MRNCQICGATQFHLTPPGNECGVDFFAMITTKGNNHVFSGEGAPLRIIGQSKKYESRVEEERIKSFNETLIDVQKKAPKITIGWMVAHKGFKTGAKTRAHNHGILLSDTIDLAR